MVSLLTTVVYHSVGIYTVYGHKSFGPSKRTKSSRRITTRSSPSPCRQPWTPPNSRLFFFFGGGIVENAKLTEAFMFVFIVILEELLFKFDPNLLF